jgi:predicted nucleotidyltransferase
MNETSIVRTLQSAFPDVLGIYLFGSRASGHAQPDSDLDLAILVPAYAAPLALWDVSGRIADEVGCDVDLIDLRAASTVMQYQIITQGRRLWAGDVSAGIYECFILSEKTELDTARAGLLDDIRKEGRIHGR